MKYRRSFAPGGVFFFTVVTFQRRNIPTQEPAIDLLRQRRYWEHLIRYEEDWRRARELGG